MLISFEGIDGSGKTTLSRKVYSFLRDKGFDVSLYREPGGTPAGEEIRKIVIEDRLSERAELLLFEASRAQLVETRIIPDLKRGAVVLIDRFVDSTIAYQGFGRGIDLELIKELNDFASFGIEPDLTFILDIEPSIALTRTKRETHFESLEFLKRVRKGFMAIASSEKDRVIVIDASKGKDAVFQETLRILRMRFPEIFRF